MYCCFFFQAEDGIRDIGVTGVQTCALPIFIPGIKPGKDTADYIDTIMSRLTLPGSFFIAFIAVMPALAHLLNVQDAFSQFFGGTSLLILEIGRASCRERV